MGAILEELREVDVNVSIFGPFLLWVDLEIVLIPVWLVLSTIYDDTSQLKVLSSTDYTAVGNENN